MNFEMIRREFVEILKPELGLLGVLIVNKAGWQPKNALRKPTLSVQPGRLTCELKAHELEIFFYLRVPSRQQKALEAGIWALAESLIKQNRFGCKNIAIEPPKFMEEIQIIEQRARCVIALDLNAAETVVRKNPRAAKVILLQAEQLVGNAGSGRVNWDREFEAQGEFGTARRQIFAEEGLFKLELFDVVLQSPKELDYGNNLFDVLIEGLDGKVKFCDCCLVSVQHEMGVEKIKQMGLVSSKRKVQV